MHACRLSVNRTPPGKPSSPLLSPGVNTPGETNRWMTLKEGGFCPMRSYPCPPMIQIQGIQNKSKSQSDAGFFNNDETTAPRRRRSGARRRLSVSPPACLPTVPRSLACSARLCRRAVDVRLRKNSERRGTGNVTKCGQGEEMRREEARRREEGERRNGPLLDNPVGWSGFLMDIQTGLSKHC